MGTPTAFGRSTALPHDYHGKSPPPIATAHRRARHIRMSMKVSFRTGIFIQGWLASHTFPVVVEKHPLQESRTGKYVCPMQPATNTMVVPQQGERHVHPPH